MPHLPSQQTSKPPKHGGCVYSLSQAYGRPVVDWLDLSSGINPNTYPVGTSSKGAWGALPFEHDTLKSAAAAYYGCDSILMVPGSQWAIEILPSVVGELIASKMQQSRSRVLVPKRGYAEHAYRWGNAGYEISYYCDLPSKQQRNGCDVCVLINPNNPTGYRASPTELAELHDDLIAQDAFLIVDEAFMDATPEYSILNRGKLSNLIVLRSLGKFFGLAGARVGAVIASPELLRILSANIPIWSISGPSREAAERAYLDREWQLATRRVLLSDCSRMVKLLFDSFGVKSVGCELFQTLYIDDAESVFEALCCAGVAVRLLDDKKGLRFGLPAHESNDWQRLEFVLNELAYPQAVGTGELVLGQECAESCVVE
jgi:cobalamin biosynthesis protein CobC